MNRRELVKAIAAHTGIEPRQVDAVVKGFTEVTTAVVAKGEPVAITGFAKFAKRELPARMGRNPATGEQIRIKASKKVRITPLKGFKDSVMSPSKAPKLARGVWPAAPAAPAAKKSAAASTAKATTKKATTKAAATKATTKKAATKKATTKKAAVTKATTKKAAATKRTTAKKAAKR